MRKIRLVIVDDSAFVVNSLLSILAEDREVEVVGHTTSGREAVALVKKTRPDVLLLDINMPEVDGVMVTRQVMENCPTRILLLTALEPLNLSVIRALELGAVDIFSKEGGNERAPFFKSMIETLISSIRTVATARLPERRSASERAAGRSADSDRLRDRFDLILIGLSTGGPAALSRILKVVPADFPPPILVVQHITDGYSTSLTRSLQAHCPLVVKEAVGRERIEPGVVYIAPTGFHLEVGSLGRIHLSEEAPCRGFRPSVDMLFFSAAKYCRNRVLALVLTGMGDDGCDGATRLKEKGQTVYIQDEASSVVWGMPGEIAKRGHYDRIMALDEICDVFSRG